MGVAVRAFSDFRSCVSRNSKLNRCVTAAKRNHPASQPAIDARVYSADSAGLVHRRRNVFGRESATHSSLISTCIQDHLGAALRARVRNRIDRLFVDSHESFLSFGENGATIIDCRPAKFATHAVCSRLLMATHGWREIQIPTDSAILLIILPENSSAYSPSTSLNPVSLHSSNSDSSVSISLIL